MSVDYRDPAAQPGLPVEPYALRLDPDGPQVIGLLANGFPDSEAFLSEVERALGARMPGATFRRYLKDNASAVASDLVLDGITAECAAVVTAYGH